MSDDSLAVTPSQTAGPYLAIGLLRDLVVPHLVDPSDPRAIRVTGVLIDGAGAPVPDGMIEAWQAGPDGRYASPDDDDPTWGMTRSGTVPDGRFELVVVKPGAVPWPEGGLQAPHLEIGVFARGLLKRLATRMYFPDEVEANEADPVLSRLDEQRRQTLIAHPHADGLRFDIVIQGAGETTFFAV